MHLDDPTFPPLLTGHAAAPGVVALDEAVARASRGELSAGDLVWSRHTAKADCALILEPEVSLTRACQMAALASVAAGEALGHLCPPQVAVEFRWPGTLLVNGAEAGSVRLAAPHADDGPPRFLVVGVTLMLRHNERGEPGDLRDQTSLAEEGAGAVTRSEFISTLAKLLLVWLHTWGEDGFRPIHEQWLFRAEGRDKEIAVAGDSGRVLGLDEDGNLMLGTAGGVVAKAYLPHVLPVPS